MRWLVLFVAAVVGCMSDADRHLYDKVSVVAKIIRVEKTQWHFDNLVLEYPNGCRVRRNCSRGLYDVGDTYYVEMRRWQATKMNQRAQVGVDGN